MNLEHVTEFGISQTPQAEFDRRMARMWKEVEEQHLAAMVFFSCDAVTYLTGSPLIPTERPMEKTQAELASLYQQVLKRLG